MTRRKSEWICAGCGTVGGLQMWLGICVMISMWDGGVFVSQPGFFIQRVPR